MPGLAVREFFMQQGESGTPLALTLSGNEITDLVRAAALSGDGLSPEGSMGIREPTTNLVPNGGFETNTTGWAGHAGVGETLTRVTSDYKFGAACLKVETTGGAVRGARTNNITVVNGSLYTGSIWFKGVQGNTYTVYLTDVTVGTASTVLVATGSCERVSVSRTMASTTARIGVYASAASDTFYIDGAQLEQQPLATPYVETDGGTASRSAARVQVPVAGVLDETQGWVAIRCLVPATVVYNFGRVFNWADASDDRISIEIYDSGGPRIYFLRQNPSGSQADPGGNLAGGSDNTVIFAWTASQVKASVNGAAFVVVSGTPYVPDLAASLACVGGDSFVTTANSDITSHWFACGLGILTDADAAAIHAWGNSDPPPGLFPAAADLSLVWRAIDNQARTY